mmetsp:Transcript_43445/g.114837  ORF Transcript_43445/g.114837 Transcript_43445/m.114837 type:complete len:141 (+) Transcript_43445:21-443(+)
MLCPPRWRSMRSILLLLLALPCAWSFHLTPLATRLPQLSPRAVALASQQPQRQGGILGAWEDVLDYLTNMGGYTGFTEEELKSLQADGRELQQRDMEDFGKPTEGLNETTTSAFVILLILLGPGLMLLSVAIYGPPAFFP